jgi:hypothetical protein
MRFFAQIGVFLFILPLSGLHSRRLECGEPDHRFRNCHIVIHLFACSAFLLPGSTDRAFEAGPSPAPGRHQLLEGNAVEQQHLDLPGCVICVFLFDELNLYAPGPKQRRNLVDYVLQSPSGIRAQGEIAGRIPVVAPFDSKPWCHDDSFDENVSSSHRPILSRILRNPERISSGVPDMVAGSANVACIRCRVRGRSVQ